MANVVKKIVPMSFLALFFMGGGGCEPPPASVKPPEPPLAVGSPRTVKESPVAIEPPVPQPPPATHFVEADRTPFPDHREREPERPDDVEAPPAGAIARCEDGTYSFSKSRSGACSNHGGVDIWYPDERPGTLKGPPAGATAECRDGTYSFSQSNRNVCASHGGVAVWYR